MLKGSRTVIMTRTNLNELTVTSPQFQHICDWQSESPFSLLRLWCLSKADERIPQKEEWETQEGSESFLCAVCGATAAE